MTGFPLILSRSSHFALDERPQYIVLISHAWAGLTLWMVQFDIETIQNSKVEHAETTQQNYPLWAAGFMRESYNVYRLEESFMDARDSMSKRSLIDNVLTAFDKLGELLSMSLEAPSTMPQLYPEIGAVCQLLTAILKVESDSISITEEESTHIQEHQTKACQLWQKASEFFRDNVEKQTTALNRETANSLLIILADLYAECLRGQYGELNTTKESFQQQFQFLRPTHCIAAMQWHWKVTLLTELIKSGHMQIRVWATGLLCGTLIDIWKSFGTASLYPAPEFVSHVGDWLQQSEFIDYLFGANSHPEILTESGNIIGFLVVNRQLRQDQLDRIWARMVSSQESRLSEALTRTMTGIIDLFHYDDLTELCERLRSAPLARLQTGLGPFRQQVFKNMLQKIPNDKVLGIHPFALCLFIIRETSVPSPGSTVIDPELFKAAAHDLDGLIEHGVDKATWNELYKDCADDIMSNSSTTLGSILGLLRLRGVQEDKGSETDSQKEQWIRLVTEELKHSIQYAKASTGVPVLSGPYNEPRRVAVKEIISAYSPPLDGENGQQIFDFLVGEAATGMDDRTAGWYIIISSASETRPSMNPFLRACCTKYLPSLPAECFCEGMLTFVERQLEPIIAARSGFALEDEATFSQSILLQLWRVILGSEDSNLGKKAVQTLAKGVYLDSGLVTSSLYSDVSKAHFSLVSRCLEQMRSSSRSLKLAAGGTPSDDDEAMVVAAPSSQIEDHKRAFARSLEVLWCFLETHRDRPQFSVPSLRQLVAEEDFECEGEPVELKCQWFDGPHQSDVEILPLGTRNTVAHLMASIHRRTKFENFRMYHRGAAFRPKAEEKSKTLEELNLLHGLLLVKEEVIEGSLPDIKAKSQLSLLEAQIHANFGELWNYLAMDDSLANEVCFEFL